jgi:hypothetical protein
MPVRSPFLPADRDLATARSVPASHGPGLRRAASVDCSRRVRDVVGNPAATQLPHEGQHRHDSRRGAVSRMTIGLFVALGFVLLLMVLVAGAGVMFFDLTGRREEDAEWLQATISDELRRDASSSSLPVLAVVHAPIGAGVAVTVQLEGEVPSEAAHRAVVQIVQGTGRKLRREIEIDDRLSIDRHAVAATRG